MPISPFYTDSHEVFRAGIRRFVEREIRPHVDVWDEAAEFPRSLYERAGAQGILGVGFPEELGGVPCDAFHKVIVSHELGRCGAGGVAAGLGSHAIGLPPVVLLGSPELRQRVVPPVLAGEKIAALAVTEPSGGSDVANLKTTARRDDDHFIVDGTKTFITSGMRADFLTVAVRTGAAGLGGISLLVIDGDAPGLTRTPLKKMGWWASDTATLYFDGCRVPATNLVGEVDQGFLGIMQNFNSERLAIAGMALGMSELAYEEAANWARERETFGRPLASRQVIRHKLVDMATQIESLRHFLDATAWRMEQGDAPIADVCMLKNVATSCLEFCAKEAVQIFGGAGYTRGVLVERLYRETKVLSIGGGAEEIMKDLAARQLGL